MPDDTKRLDWSKLLCAERVPRTDGKEASDEGADWLVASRTAAERDFDRVLFATPTRRLGDKTQVFPLERNESVRTRLTHSHEVANLARSIGTHMVNSTLGDRIVGEATREGGAFEGRDPEVRRAIPAMLAAAGLAHDLGNPPFGHQGEYAIRDWVRRNEERLFGTPAELGNALKEDFRKFEGNAQTLRTLTRLQVVKDNRGMNLTFGTLAALMKYTVGSDAIVEGGASHARKVGFFQSEAGLVARIREMTGLSHGWMRHPLTHLMEACDDIAYLVVDAEDAVKKQIVSFPDLMEWLRSRKDLQGDKLSAWILTQAGNGDRQARASGLPPSELNDVSMQIFRTNAITALISAIIRAFEARYDDIMVGELEEPLLAASVGGTFASAMKAFDGEYAYRHRRVLEIELDGFNVIHGLMDLLWRGIAERRDYLLPGSDRTSPFARYAYSRISVNYRRVFENALPSTGIEAAPLPIRYRELQLLTDMVAGMTDRFAIDLYRELQAFHVGASQP
ncbi:MULTISPECIES: dGTP triphosphohydrolase [unclassified Methylobacterium]|jgi:dGTPase|uniref:dGTP triphosphohydrolase n=1 Tax=unclassified Methylobacterium TaxID=2615210 RepID=UPI00068DAF95|nr:MULTISPECIES: dNTP triphosphohydrolase [unclassified Methylobacterium]SFU96585.1 dGTPase [Methylobacterium sp. UNCCL125]